MAAPQMLSERTYLLYDRSAGCWRASWIWRRRRRAFRIRPFWGRQIAARAAWRRCACPAAAWFAVVQSSEASAALRRLLPPLVAAIVAAALGVGLVATYLFAHDRQAPGRNAGRRRCHRRGRSSRRIATDRLDGVFAAQAQSLNQMLDRMEDMVNAQRQFASHLAMICARRSPGCAGCWRARMRAARACWIGPSVNAARSSPFRCAAAPVGNRGRAPPHRAGAAGTGAGDRGCGRNHGAGDRGCGQPAGTGRMASAEIRADTGLVQQLLVNLLDNVALHTPADTRATIALAREGGEAVITIADNGPGIAGTDRDRVMRPFDARRPARPGSGLGLAIAQAIMRFHHGDRWNWRTIAPVWPCGCAFRCPPEGAAQHSKFAM
jgi:hypothetical protein